MTYDVIVIGAGITGLTASKALAQRGVAVANLEGNLFGGLVTNVNELEGAYAGSGADFASNLMMEVGDLGCAALSETVTDVAADRGELIIGTDAGEHRARALIVASGAALKRLGVPGETELEYKGVSHCADCDGPIFQGQDVVVVGGGDSALQEALVLSHFCASVRVVHRGPAFTARSHWVDALRVRDNVTALPNSEIDAIEGGDAVEAVRVRSLADGTTQRIPCAAVFAYIGLAPSTRFLPSAVRRDAEGAIVTDDALATAMPGVFAAGAARAGYGGTLADAVREGERAASAALSYLAGARMSQATPQQETL
jgi:thioredoxin reductase (NADPH)